MLGLPPPSRSNHFLAENRAQMWKGKFNLIDSVVQENQEVHLMNNFPLPLKLNLSISVSWLLRESLDLKPAVSSQDRVLGEMN